MYKCSGFVQNEPSFGEMENAVLPRMKLKVIRVQDELSGLLYESEGTRHCNKAEHRPKQETRGTHSVWEPTGLPTLLDGRRARNKGWARPIDFWPT